MDVLRQVASVFLVFALLGFVVWKLRRGPIQMIRTRARSLASLERLSLTPQHTLHVVKIHKCEVLIATHPHGCSILNLDREASLASPDREGVSVQSRDRQGADR
jgi:flagellar biogenesis protein FliO